MYSYSVTIWTTGATSVSLVLCPSISALLSPSQVPVTNVSPPSVSSGHIVAVPLLLSFPPASRSHAFSFYNPFSFGLLRR